MTNSFRKTTLTALLFLIPCLGQATSKPDYGQVDIIVKNSQPCFYLSGYTRQVAQDSDPNKLVYAILFRGSRDLFIVHNTYLDIPNNPQTCLPVSAMESLTAEATVIPNKPYGIELILGIENDYSNGANYMSEFCLAEDKGRFSIVEVDYKKNPNPDDNAIAYCSNKELKEQKSWFQILKEWLRSIVT